MVPNKNRIHTFMLFFKIDFDITFITLTHLRFSLKSVIRVCRPLMGVNSNTNHKLPNKQSFYSLVSYLRNRCTFPCRRILILGSEGSSQEF